MFSNRQWVLSSLLTAFIASTLATSAMAQDAVAYQAIEPFSTEIAGTNYSELSPTVPNDELDFTDDSNLSCCTRIPGKERAFYRTPKQSQTETVKYAVSNINASGPQVLVQCERYNQLPVLVSNQSAPPTDIQVNKQLSIFPRNAFKVTDSNVLINNARYRDSISNRRDDVATGYFHVSSVAGNNRIAFQDVANYSVCVARGSNVVEVRNTDNGSLLAYNGSDYLRLAGNNTNMLTRAGGGNDVIEVEQADPLPLNDGVDSAFRGEKWSANNVYRTAISGGDGTDILALVNSPLGTKWCHIGDATNYGELFHIVEFALPPSVTKGPRRQRISIGNSVEYIIFNGKKYSLENFLNNGLAGGDLEFAITDDAINAVGVAQPVSYSRYSNPVLKGEPVAMPVITTGDVVRGLY
jgi:hypothetical protein